MPTHYSLGPDDGYGVKNARAVTIEPNEQSAVGPTHMQSMWRALLEDIELMPQDEDFGFQPTSRLEAVAQHADDEEPNCDHQSQSCSDSLAAATPADGVFGSDSYPLRRFTPQHIELVPKDKDFGLQGRPRPEQPDDSAPDQSAEIAHRGDYQPIRR
jgi:hypothetical protein